MSKRKRKLSWEGYPIHIPHDPKVKRALLKAWEFGYTAGKYSDEFLVKKDDHIRELLFELFGEEETTPETSTAIDVEGIKQTLEFYAFNWRYDVYVGPSQELLKDSGQKAKDLLAKIESTSHLGVTLISEGESPETVESLREYTASEIAEGGTRYLGIHFIHKRDYHLLQKRIQELTAENERLKAELATAYKQDYYEANRRLAANIRDLEARLNIAKHNLLRLEVNLAECDRIDRERCLELVRETLAKLKEK